MALARLDIPGLMLYGGSIAPGHLHLGPYNKPLPDGPTARLPPPPPPTTNNQQPTTSSTSPSSRSSKPSAPTPPAKSPTPSSKRPKPPPVPAPEPAAASSPPTPWPWPASSSASRPIQLTGVPATSSEAKHDASRARPANSSWTSPAPASSPRRSSPANPSETPLPPSAPPVVRRMPSSTSSPSPSELNIPLSTVDDFDTISERTPFICDLQPGGKYVARDYQDAGGSPPPRRSALSSKATPPRQQPPPSPARPSAKKPPPPTKPKASPIILPWSNPAQTHRRPGHPQRQPRPRRLRDQSSRPRAHSTIPAPPASSTPKTICFAAIKARAASTPTTSSSSAMKAPAAAPACAKC